MRRLVFILALLALPCVAQTIQLQPGALATCTATAGCTTNAIDASGASIVIGACGLDLGAPNTNVCSISAIGCTFTPLTQRQGGGTTQIFYSTNCNNAGQTFTCSGSLSGGESCAVAGFIGSAAFDVENGAGNVSTVSSIQTGSITPAGSSDVVVSSWVGIDQNFPTVAVNSSLIIMENSPNRFQPLAFALGIGGVEFDPCAASSCMTSNTVPSPYVASESSQQNAAFNCFDGNVLTHCLTAATTGYICLDLGSGNAQTLYAYTLQGNDDQPNRNPKNWTFEGSNTSCTSGMTVLDTEINQTGWINLNGTGGELRGFSTSGNSTAYRYYRLNCSANNGDGSFMGVAEIKLWAGPGAAGTINPTWSTSPSTSMVAAIAAFKPLVVNIRHRGYVDVQ